MPDRSSSGFCSSSCCMPPARHRRFRTQEKRLRFFSTVGLRRALKDRELDAKERIISEALGKDFPSPGHRGNSSRFILLDSQKYGGGVLFCVGGFPGAFGLRSRAPFVVLRV